MWLKSFVGSPHDKAGIRLSGFVSSHGWVELANPASRRLSLKLFNIKSCARRAFNKKSDKEDSSLQAFTELGEFQLVLRTWRTAAMLIMPWNHSFTALELHQQQVLQRRSWGGGEHNPVRCLPPSWADLSLSPRVWALPDPVVIVYVTATVICQPVRAAPGILNSERMTYVTASVIYKFWDPQHILRHL